MYPVFRFLPALYLGALLTACGGGTAAKSATASPTASHSVAATIVASLATPTAPAVPTLAASPPASASPSATGAPATPSAPSGATLTVTGTGGAGLTLREAPNGKRLLVVSEGSLLTALDDPPQEANGLTWVHVKTPSGAEGWVAKQYVSGGSVAPGTPAATAKPTAG